MNFTSFDNWHFLVLLPELALILLAAIVMFIDAAAKPSRQTLGIVTGLGLVVIAGLTIVFVQPPIKGEMLFGGTIRDDMLGFVFRVLFLFAAAMTALLSSDVVGLRLRGEYFIALIAATIGINFMAISTDLVMLYLALETTSIASYVLAGFLMHDKKSTESGVKYFLFGAVTSAVMLFGFSLLYGVTGTTNLYAIADVLRSGTIATPIILGIALLILAGLGFKVSAFPFHFWAPDVYEGAPSPVTAFISTASKAAGFAVLVRIFFAALGGSAVAWNPLLIAMTVVTMSIGNLSAIVQKNIKRLLAYSSVAHAGYVLMGVIAFQNDPTISTASIVYYLVGYVLTNLAAFAVIILFSRIVGSDEIKDYAGLQRRSPILALVLLIAFLSLAGIPPLAGFFGKFFLFQAVIKANYMWVAIVAAINPLIALYYYLIVLKVIYVDPTPEDAKPITIPAQYTFALVLLCLGVILVGTVAGPWYEWAIQAAQSLF